MFPPPIKNPPPSSTLTAAEQVMLTNWMADRAGAGGRRETEARLLRSLRRTTDGR